MPDISLGDARRLGVRLLTRHKVSEKNAAPTVESLLRAEMEGIPSHGFSRIPYYVGQTDTGKVDGHAEPAVTRPKPGVVRVDARCGFAFRAFAEGLPELAAAAREQGIALMGVCNSHHAGVLGFPVADLAAQAAGPWFRQQPGLSGALRRLQRSFRHQPSGPGLPAQGRAAAGH